MTLKQIVEEAHQTAIDKGWWDRERTDLEIHALIHSELAEATEAYRSGKFEHQVHELADVVIRIADYCGARGWDLEQVVLSKMSFNKTRPYRHGGKLA